MIHEKYEASVLTNEVIEVHLDYLRAGFDSMQAALPVLRDKIDRLSETVDLKFEKTNARIDALNTSLSEKIDKANEQRAAGDAGLSQKIDKVAEQSEARDAVLGAKIDKVGEQSEARDTALGKRIDTLTEKVSKVSDGLAEVQGYQKALFWVISLATIVAAIVSIAHTLDWI